MSKKLVIRINNLQDIEASDDYEVAEEIAIRWDRVISVSVVAVLLLVALVWCSWYLFSSEESAHEAPIFEAVSEPVTKDVEPPLIVAQDLAPLVDTDKEAEKPIAENEGQLESAPKAIVADRSQVVEADTPVIKVEKAPVLKPSVDSAEVAPTVAAAFVDPIVIKSHRIVKAQLTHGVNKSEPVDQLGNVVSMNDDKLIKLHLFTGMAGLKGETLYHDWYLSGKKMARVRIKVRSDKTSASSSKFIDQYMMGDWKVQVTTSRGEELVSARFNVTP